MATRTGYTIWVCHDCTMMLANGERMEGADREPLGLLTAADVTLGMLADEHHDDCDLRNSYAARETENLFGLPERTEIHECNLECEVNGFSWQPCEGCGSTLGGDRDAVTVWEVEA